MRTNYVGNAPSRDWAVAYLETNKLLNGLGEYLIGELEKIRVKANMARFSSPGFNTDKVISCWSHRHVAYAAGLGTFGINNMLITDKGYELLKEYDKIFNDLELSEVCGKCLAMFPCSFKNPNKNINNE